MLLFPTKCIKAESHLVVSICQYYQMYNLVKITSKASPGIFFILVNLRVQSKFLNLTMIMLLENRQTNGSNSHNPCLHCLLLIFHALRAVTKRADK